MSYNLPFAKLIDNMPEVQLSFVNIATGNNQWTISFMSVCNKQVQLCNQITSNCNRSSGKTVESATIGSLV